MNSRYTDLAMDQREFITHSPEETIAFGRTLALGVAARCCRLAGHSTLDAELGRLRARLDAADAESMPAARAAAAAFAFRAAGSVVAVTGSRSILAGQHPQRLARESLFLLVFGSRPAIRENLVRMLVSG